MLFLAFDVILRVLLLSYVSDQNKKYCRILNLFNLSQESLLLFWNGNEAGVDYVFQNTINCV